MAPESELSLESHRRDAVLTRGKQPGGVEPNCQGCARPVEDGAGRDTGTEMARQALVAPDPLSQPAAPQLSQTHLLLVWRNRRRRR